MTGASDGPTRGPGPGAGVVGQPRARVRLARPRARALRRRRGRPSPPDGLTVEVLGRGRRPGAAATTAPGRAGHAPHLGRLRRRPARHAAALPQRHPALARAGQLGRRGGGRRGGRSGARRARPGAGARRRCCRSRPVWRGTPTTRRRACSAASWSPGRTPGIPASGSTLYGSTRTRASGRWRSSRRSSRPPATTRGLLPDRVPLADAAFTGSRTALAVLAFTQRPELLLPATEDRLHQGYRRPAYPESAELVDALRERGVPAADLRSRADGARPDHRRHAAGRGRPARLHAAAAGGRHRGRRGRDRLTGRAASRAGVVVAAAEGTSTLGSATAIHASSAWPLEPDTPLFRSGSTERPLQRPSRRSPPLPVGAAADAATR